MVVAIAAVRSSKVHKILSGAAIINRDKDGRAALTKSLTMEAESSFCDLQGRQYRFSEFLILTLGQTPRSLTKADQKRWLAIASALNPLNLKTKDSDSEDI